MKSIKQSMEVSFNAPEFQDALTMLPLMDELAKNIVSNKKGQVYRALPAEEQEKYVRYYQGNAVTSEESDKRIFKLLLSLGYVTQVEIKEVYSTDDLEEVRSRK